MNTNKIKALLTSNSKFFCLMFKLINYLNVKNKLIVHGVTIKSKMTYINGLKIYSNGVNNIIVFSDFVRVKNCKVYFYGDNNTVYIGNNSTLNNTVFHLEDNSNEIIIGENTNFCGEAHLATIEGTKICVGDNCLLSSDIHFRTGDSHSIIDAHGNRINPSQSICIDNHVWIGTRVTCLKGVHVSENTVVAATATLCKDYSEANCIIAGIPGKIIKNNINWCKERILISPKLSNTDKTD